uniref:MICAL-like protein 1 n=1 Tax=Anopheles dirus TaxID=7168 RepID=A0A182NCY4_9DIPT
MSERRGTKALELWCRRIAEGYKDVKVTNMSTSWRDGLAFCAIIHNFRPDLIDFASLSKDNVYYNNELAFTIAEQHLGIPSLLDPADMVKYEVPDRFSILTYLSQYYRVFSNQEPANKKTAAKDTKTDDLTSKMASIPAFVGVPKRASCNRCSNPIFLAERISFGEKSYHRSCLKCARCGTQLTVGSFYETETDGEYCCETCPDEEIQLEQRRESSASSEENLSPVVAGSERKPSSSSAPVGLSRNVRSSKLLDRITFFESAPLSDEEKTSNLERKTRMSHFLKETLKDVEQHEDKPPDLPAVGPPSSVRSSSEENGKAKPVATEEDVDDSEEESADENDVEDEFEKLVQGLDQEDLESQKSIPVPQPVVDRSSHVIKNELEEEIATSTPIASQDPEMNSPAEIIPQTESSKSEADAETEPLDDKKELKLEVIATAEEIDVKMLELEHIEDVTETTEASDLKHEQVQAVEEDKTSETLHESSTEISDNVAKDTPTAVVAVIVETETPTSAPETESLPKDSNVPEENERTELKMLPILDASDNSDSKLMVPNETAQDTLIESKVPEKVEEKEEAKIAPLRENHEVTEPGKVEQKEDKDASSSEEQYPSDLNPFGDDDDGEANEKIVALRSVPGGGKPVPTMRRVSTNPFGSEDEDDDTPQSPAAKPPRPPPPKVKTLKPVPANPFDDDDDEGPANEPEIVPVSKPSPRRTPVPTPRKAHAYNDSISSLDNSLMSSSRLSSSNVSLASSLESGPSSIVAPRRKKGKAPDIPLATVGSSTPVVSQHQLNNSTASVEPTSVENLSNNSGTLTTPRKKRLAPAPPPIPSSSSTPKQPAKLEGEGGGLTRSPSQRLLAVDASLLTSNHREPADTVSHATSNESVVYRRTIVPLVLDDDGPESPIHSASTNTSERQWEKMKDNKEAQNRNRQSQSSPTTSEGHSFGSPGGGSGALSILSNKSSQGKWKRRKGPAPALPMIAAPLPERKPIKMLPLKEIHQELQIIETQQQGLEKQGIVLEKMIRERCEGVEADVDLDIRLQANSKEVEDLIMQLFELVNEKNELFRRQAELMYLRRMHRLEQEQADLEYEIRLLMAQPERNKTDSDKEKEEALIARLVEIVQLRNEVVECLEMDRIREAEEDLSIKQSIEERAASQQSKHGSSKKDSSASSTTLPLTDAEKRDSSTKLSKKEKKKLKEAKKLVKSKKIDSEKDADETESSTTKEKKKKRNVGVGTSGGAVARVCSDGTPGQQFSSFGRGIPQQEEPGGDIGDEIVAMRPADCR